MDWHQVLTLFAGILVREIAERYFDKRKADKVLGTAKDILESSQNPTTDLGQAAREALVLAHHEAVIVPTVERLQKQVAADEIRIANTVAHAKEVATGIDATLVPRDGSEEFKPAW